MEEAEKKRQAMLDAMKEPGNQGGRPNFVVNKKSGGAAAVQYGGGLMFARAGRLN